MKRLIISLIILVVLLSGCGTAQVTASSAGGEPTTLHVLRVNGIPENHYLPFSPRTVTDQHAVQQLYAAAKALPRLMLPGVINCPADRGLEYHLDFFQGQTLLQEMIYYPGGCTYIRLGKSDDRALTDSFLHLFAQTIGISVAELAPQPLFSCTPHSPCSSPTPSH